MMMTMMLTMVMMDGMLMVIAMTMTMATTMTIVLATTTMTMTMDATMKMTLFFWHCMENDRCEVNTRGKAAICMAAPIEATEASDTTG